MVAEVERLSVAEVEARALVQAWAAPRPVRAWVVQPGSGFGGAGAGGRGRLCRGSRLRGAAGSSVMPRDANSSLTASTVTTRPFLRARRCIASPAARAFDVAFVEQDAEQPLVRGEMLRRALDDGAQMLGRLLRQAVLGEDLRLGQVLGDEVEIVARSPHPIRGSTAAIGRCGGEASTGARAVAGRRGRSSRIEIELERLGGVEIERERRRLVERIERRRRLFDLHRRGHRSGGAVGACGRAGIVSTPPICDADELQLVAVLRVLRLALDQLLQHLDGLLVTAPCAMCASARLFIEERMFVSSLSRE